MNRGGGWNNNPARVRSANRNRNTPTNRNNNVGFRLAESAALPECAGASPPGSVQAVSMVPFRTPQGRGVE